MGWLFESFVEQIWDEYIYRIYKHSGWKWAAVAILGPIMVLAMAIGFVALVLS
jgi:hypothetical protein